MLISFYLHVSIFKISQYKLHATFQLVMSISCIIIHVLTFRALEFSGYKSIMWIIEVIVAVIFFELLNDRVKGKIWQNVDRFFKKMVTLPMHAGTFLNSSANWEYMFCSQQNQFKDFSLILLMGVVSKLNKQERLFLKELGGGVKKLS